MRFYAFKCLVMNYLDGVIKTFSYHQNNHVKRNGNWKLVFLSIFKHFFDILKSKTFGLKQHQIMEHQICALI